jgi:hypothetical protein
VAPHVIKATVFRKLVQDSPHGFFGSHNHPRPN